MKTVLLLCAMMLLPFPVEAEAAPKDKPSSAMPVVLPKLKYYKHPENLDEEALQQNNDIAIKHLENCHAIVSTLIIDARKLNKSERETYELFVEEDLDAEILRLCTDNIVRTDMF